MPHDEDDNAGDTAVPAPRPEASAREPRSRGLFSNDSRPSGSSGPSRPGWLESLTATLSELAADVTSVEVRTYAADDVGTAVSSPNRLEEGAQLRAWTRIALDGDTDICVPTHDGKIDRALWELHLGVVSEAQAHRTEMVKTLIQSVSGLWSLIR